MHFNHPLIPKEIQNLFQKHFNILGCIEFKQFDYNLQTLRNFFKESKKELFDVNDRYIIIHQDTDIYIPEMSVGVNLRNFFQIVNELDIPLFTILLWTNHFGIKKEIDILCQNSDNNNYPTILESFCATSHVGDKYNNISLTPENIEYHALCMMGSGRSHRFGLYNHLKDDKRIEISIKGLKE